MPVDGGVDLGVGVPAADSKAAASQSSRIMRLDGEVGIDVIRSSRTSASSTFRRSGVWLACSSRAVVPTPRGHAEEHRAVDA